MACHNSNGYTPPILMCLAIEPTDARRAFPCWDEPAIKASFEVEITTDKALTVLSNMDVNSEKESGETKTTLFNPTPKMSTYVRFTFLFLSSRCLMASSLRLLSGIWGTLKPRQQRVFR